MAPPVNYAGGYNTRANYEQGNWTEANRTLAQTAYASQLIQCFFV